MSSKIVTLLQINLKKEEALPSLHIADLGNIYFVPSELHSVVWEFEKNKATKSGSGRNAYLSKRPICEIGLNFESITTSPIPSGERNWRWIA